VHPVEEKHRVMDDLQSRSWFVAVWPGKRCLFLLCWLLTLPSLAAPPRATVPYQLGKLEINNQTSLAFRRYVSTHPRGVILYLHGIQSHSGWYIQSCQLLAENGYTVYAPDRRGSGLNGVDRGHVQNYEDLIADLDAFIARIHADYPGLPVFLVGVSWGGKLAMLYEVMRPGQVDGLILSAPGLKPKVDLSPWNKIKVFYYHWRNRDVQPEIPIPINRSDLFTDDPKWQNWIEQDPLTLRKCTARFFWENRKMDKQIKKWAKDAKAPILLMLADRDEIIDNDKTLRFMEKKLPESENGTLTLARYPTARHTLEFEANMRQVVKDMLTWLNHQTSLLKQP